MTTQDEAAPAPDHNSVENERIARVVRLARLLDLYGELLTDRQRQFLHLHCDEDMSFSEIAEEFGVSRQAVHDAVKHGSDSIEHYEEKLHLLSKAEAAPKAAEISRPELNGSITKLQDLFERLRRSGGIIYDASSITRDLGEIIAELSRLSSPSDEESTNKS